MKGVKLFAGALACAVLLGAGNVQAGHWFAGYYGVVPSPAFAGAYFTPAPVVVSYPPVAVPAVVPVAYETVVPSPVVTTNYIVPTTAVMAPIGPYIAPHRVSYFPRRGVVRVRY
jgi:hypothetical protein